MKNITFIFARFWALWGLISFFISFLLVLPISLVKYLYKNEKKGQDYFNRLSKIWMRVWLALIGFKVEINGLEYFDCNKNYIVVFNHNSMLDIPLSSPFVPGGNKTIGKSSFSKIPFFGIFYKMGTVLVDRKNMESRKKSYEQMKEVLNKGMHMCIYPEGTRNRTTMPLKPFFDGAFKLAIETNTAIIPCVLEGTKKALPPHQLFYLYPTRLTMNFLSPVFSDQLTVEELKNKVFEMMENKIKSQSTLL